jgi:hypothetical protein
LGSGLVSVRGRRRRLVPSRVAASPPTSPLTGASAHARMPRIECPLCLEWTYHTSTTFCGHTFCSACLSRWVAAAGTCPVCREGIRKDGSMDDSKEARARRLTMAMEMEHEERERERLRLLEQERHNQCAARMDTGPADPAHPQVT